MGREIGQWVMEIVGLFFLDLFDECILRAFSLLSNMKNFRYFRLLAECSMYSNSSSGYCGLGMNRQRNHFSRRHILYPTQRLPQILHRRNPKQSRNRIYEHKRSIKIDDDRNALFSNILEHEHTINFSRATLIKLIHYKTSRRLLETAGISKTNHIRLRPGFYQISPYLANIILHENNIKIESE